MTEDHHTLRFLYGLEMFGIKVGLRNISRLLHRVGNPHRRYHVIHIAGTNGKGSTAAMLAAILAASGYRTGFYSSPHLIEFNERIRVNGRKISDAELIRYTRLLKPTIEETRATFFEAATAIAFLTFAEQMVDVAVVETGLGGRLDATNVVNPVLSIITNIGLEHVEYLGTTHAQIAREKAGIIKRGVPCIAGTEVAEATRVLQRTAARRNSAFHHVDGSVRTELIESTLNGSTICLRTNRSTYKNLFLSLAGEFQVRNAKLSVLAADLLRVSGRFNQINEKSIARGLGNVSELSGWRGRIDVVRNSPLILADVAHNPDGMRALMRSLRLLLPGKILAVFGVLKDKDMKSMVAEMAPTVRALFAVNPDSPRGLDSKCIVMEMHRAARKAVDAGSVGKGLKLAIGEARPGEPILVTGSHFVVGEAMKSLGITV